MGREIRRVPMDWQHPKDWRGNYIPLYDRTYEEALDEHSASGDADAWKPTPEYYRPKWDDNALLGWCMYEDVSEGTPVSPVFATSDELALWLVESQGISLAGAHKFIEMGWSPSFVMSPQTGFINGLEYVDHLATYSDDSDD